MPPKSHRIENTDICLLKFNSSKLGIGRLSNVDKCILL